MIRMLRCRTKAFRVNWVFPSLAFGLIPEASLTTNPDPSVMSMVGRRPSDATRNHK
jgi:hypothetical protein